MPDFEIERGLMTSDPAITRIVGLDEVGRGPFAGPVTACAVVLDPDYIPDGLNDSKKLTPKRREALFDIIHHVAEVCVIHVSVEEIDRINILQASLLAMSRAVAGLATPPHYALVDGRQIPVGLPCPAHGIIKGDAKSSSIAAASIVAKVTRDRLMVALAQQFPGYKWGENMGYGTKAHIEALKTLGVTPHHRRSFRPIHNILCQQNN